MNLLRNIIVVFGITLAIFLVGAFVVGVYGIFVSLW